MESLLNTSYPSPENQQTLNPHPKLLELASDSGVRRLPKAGSRPPPDPKQLPCPRCDSADTKFCYYNNYNLSQPRHYCRSCRRYWTRGGALRNVPVGGGTRRAASSSSNKRPRKSAAAVASNGDNLVSSGSCNGLLGRSQTLEPDPDLGSGSKEANPGGLWFWGNGQMGLGGGHFAFSGVGLGLGPYLGYEQAAFDWPVEQVSGGDGGAVVASGDSPGCGTRQMGGGADGGGLVEGDYFSWPDLAISTPTEALK